MKLLCTGSMGFIGSNFVHYILNKYPEYEVVNFDKLTYAGNPENLKDVADNPRYKFVQGDIAEYEEVNNLLLQHKFDIVVNFAAETHVDRSIQLGNKEFVLSNVLGVQVLLDDVRKFSIPRMIQISTDEVYGSLELNEGWPFTEDNPMAPNAPYAAAKAGGDMLCRAAFHTYGTPVIVTHCSNNYGPYQFPEKLIPFFISKALKNEPLPLYGDGKNVRDWVYVEDHCSAIDEIMHIGFIGEIYNIGGGNERSNLEVAKIILKDLGKPESLLTFVEDRLGHDRRYAIDSSKIERELGWKAKYSFEDAIHTTIDWYKANEEWMKKAQ